MKMNNNTDIKVTWELNEEIHSENFQASKMEVYLWNI